MPEHWSISERAADLAIEQVANGETTEDDYDFAVRAIVADITDRRGLKGEWYATDPEIRQDIMQVWRFILRKMFPAHD